MSKKYRSIREEAKNLIVQYAIFRWENAVILAGAILLTVFYPKPFAWWPIWGWLVFGLVGVGAITYSSLTNAETNARLVLLSFQDHINAREIKLPGLREDVEMALRYQRRIDEYLRKQDESLLWDRAQTTASQIQNWIENVYHLAIRLDVYRRDTLLKQEMKELPAEIKSLTAQREKEKDANLIEEFDQLIESKQKHYSTLETLDSKMKQAALQLEHSLSALATLDSQVRLIAAQDVDGGRSERLKADIQEQIDRLGDLLDSINEVYTVNGAK